MKEKITYRKASVLIMSINTLSGVIIVLILLAFFVQYKREKQYLYTYLPKSKPQRLIPLHEPNVSTAALLRWVSLAATTAYTMDFVTYENTLAEIKQYFTKAGYKNFMDSLEANNRLNDIIDKKLVTSAVVYGPAVILQEGPTKGYYAWKIQLPLLLTYQGASERSTQAYITVNLFVTRVPTTDAPKGIGIVQITDTSFQEQRN